MDRTGMTLTTGAAAVFVAIPALLDAFFWPITPAVAAVFLTVLALLCLGVLPALPRPLAWTGLAAGALWIMTPRLWEPISAWLAPVMPLVGGVVLLALGISILLSGQEDVASAQATAE